MNKENMQKLIDKLNSLENEQFNMHHFNLYDYETGCSSPSCIAGWAASMIPSANVGYGGHIFGAYSTAKDWLELDVHQADQLFTPDQEKTYQSAGFDPYTASPKEAARVCERLMHTNVVDWSVAIG